MELVQGRELHIGELVRRCGKAQGTPMKALHLRDPSQHELLPSSIPWSSETCSASVGSPPRRSRNRGRHVLRLGKANQNERATLVLYISNCFVLFFPEDIQFSISKCFFFRNTKPKHRKRDLSPEVCGLVGLSWTLRPKEPSVHTSICV